MNRIFIVEDEVHAAWLGEYPSFAAALADLKDRSAKPWDSKENVAPCSSWKTCERQYLIIEYDNTHQPWTEIARTPIFTISQQGIVWDYQI
jgi:hypothetical protein